MIVVYAQVFCALSVPVCTHLYLHGETERLYRSETGLSSRFSSNVFTHSVTVFSLIHRGLPAHRGRSPKRSSEPREICETGGEKKKSVKSGP